MQTIGIREFREHLSKYTYGEEPVQVTSHGRAVGYYIPAVPADNPHPFEALQTAAKRLQTLMDRVGVREEQIVEEFKQARQSGRHDA